MLNNIEELNNNRKRVSFVKLALNMVLILMMGVLFIFTWFNHYYEMLRFQYIYKGNVFLFLIYVVILYVLMHMFDCMEISVYKIYSLVFSVFLAALTCNIFTYLVIIMPAIALGFVDFMPMIYLTLYDLALIIIWYYSSFYIIKTISPKKDLLLISSKSSIDKELVKLSFDNDHYNIKANIIFDKNLKDVTEKCDCFNDIIIGDIKSEDRNDIIKYCFNKSKNVYVIPKLSDILIKYSNDLFEYHTPIYLSSDFSLSVENEFFKRVFDIAFSLIIIVAFLPLWIFVALAIFIEDRGPVFYFQKRVTKDEKEFNIIKFRSMRVSNENEVMPTLKDDDRITKVGKIIRKLHIDEIPQFINVLLGDMSVVGPRPERIEHVKLYTKEIKEFVYRYKVKAGITGLAQVYGKYNTTAIDKLKLDLIYIKKYSFLFDIELIMRTLKVFLINENTEGFDIESQNYIKENAK